MLNDVSKRGHWCVRWHWCMFASYQNRDWWFYLSFMLWIISHAMFSLIIRNAALWDLSYIGILMIMSKCLALYVVPLKLIFPHAIITLYLMHLSFCIDLLVWLYPVGKYIYIYIYIYLYIYRKTSEIRRQKLKWFFSRLVFAQSIETRC